MIKTAPQSAIASSRRAEHGVARDSTGKGKSQTLALVEQPKAALASLANWHV
jgi:hypothetical protein